MVTHVPNRRGSEQAANQNDGKKLPATKRYGQTESEFLTDRLQDQVIQTVVASSSDAVGLLFRAAGSSESEVSDDGEIDTGPAQSTATNVLSPSLNTHEAVSSDVLELWSRHRFVRQGWFTAREGEAYVQA